MTATATAPIGARQINSNLYVGQSDLSNIQKAVTFAVSRGGGFAVIVPTGYGWGDSIAAVTGGASSVYIIDQRATSPQSYFWTGTQYVPAALVQLGGYSADFAGGNPNIPMTGNLILDGVFDLTSNSFGGVGSTVAGLLISCNVSNGSSETDFINTRPSSTPAGGFNWYDGVAPNSIDEDTVPIMRLDGSGNLGIGLSLTAPVANFDECFVDGSPVLTSTSPIGMIYPDPGVTVSDGDAWGDSIDPASLQGTLTLTTNGSSGAATLVNNTLNIPRYTTNMVYPAAGIGVSTGSAWGTSIDPATLALLDVDNTGTLTVSGDFSGGGFTALQNLFPTSLSNTTLRSDGHGNATLQVPVALYFNLDSGSGGIHFGNGSGAVIGAIDTAGNANFNGQISAAGTIGPAKSAMTMDFSGGVGRLIASTAAGVATATDMLFVSLSGDGSAYNEFMRYHATGNYVGIGGGVLDIGGVIKIASNTTVNYNAPTLQANSGNVTLNAGTGGGVWFNYVGGGNVVNFANGVGAVVGSVDSSGNAHFNGTLTAGTKNFKVTHPTDSTKWLNHSCLEGAEICVYYRGTATVGKDGRAEVLLPDYFEAFTRPEGRSVHLTQVATAKDVAKRGFATFTATDVHDGLFSIYSSEPGVKIHWLVIAVRADVPPLNVVTDNPTKQEIQ